MARRPFTPAHRRPRNPFRRAILAPRIPPPKEDSVASELRPLPVDGAGTCDWGNCDGESVGLRRDPITGDGLPVCAAHIPPQRRPSAGRGKCPECGTDTALSVAGKVRAHDKAFAVRCPGSGKDPAGGQ
jgi:hypothetical protein